MNYKPRICYDTAYISCPYCFQKLLFSCDIRKFVTGSSSLLLQTRRVKTKRRWSHSTSGSVDVLLCYSIFSSFWAKSVYHSPLFSVSSGRVKPMYLCHPLPAADTAQLREKTISPAVKHPFNVLEPCGTSLIFVPICISVVLIKFHPILSSGLATLDHASTCCHDCCCLATVGNHGPTEPGEVCPADFFHKQFTCAGMPAYSHTLKKTTHTRMYVYSDVISEDFTKTQTNSSVSDVTVVMETSEQGLSFFSSLDTRNLLVSFISPCSSLPSPSPVPWACLLSASPWLN